VTEVKVHIQTRQRALRPAIVQKVRERVRAQVRAEVASAEGRVAFLTKLEALLAAEQRRLER
jgi:hypothetical protein